MKPRKFFPSLPTLLAAALLLTPAHAASAQRRRTARRAQTTSRPVPTPQPPTTQTQGPPQTTPTPAQTPPPTRSDAQAQPQRRAEPDAAVEDLLSADGYGVYVEARRTGTLAQSEELKTAVGALRLFGEELEPLTDVLAFFTDNSEQLSESRVVVAFLPTRAGLPEVFAALELPDAESAARFEPKFRAFVGGKVQAYTDAVVGPTNARGAQKGARQQPGAGRQPEAGRQPSVGFTFKRVGRLLLTAREPFTLRKLRGAEGTSSLAESVRFQTARTRFASDAVFVYVDTALTQQGYALEQQRAREERESQVATLRATEQPVLTDTTEPQPSPTPAPTQTREATPTTNAPTQATTPTPSPMRTPAATPSPATTPANTAAQTTPSPDATPQQQAATDAQAWPTPDASPSPGPSPTGQLGVGIVGESDANGVLRADAETAAKPSEEQATAWRMGGVLGNILRGSPRVPGAVALGLDLKSGALAARVAVENTPDGLVSVIPFLPNVLAGPPVTADAAQVAPDDADIFITTSLDWPRIYTNTLGTASLDPSLTHSRFEDDGEGGTLSGFRVAGGGQKQPTPEETVAAIEKLFGFKIKEDLLPALGNEVAVSVPFSYLTGPRLFGPARKKEEKDSEPGLALIVALQDPDKVREILPRVFVAFGFVSAGTPFAPPEKREGFEIRSAGEVAYTVINNFLVLSDDVKAVRHVVDSYAARRTLATTDAYRDSTSWQARQKVVQVFVSEALMKTAVEDTKKRSGGSTDPVVRGLLAQLDMRPEPASYEATNEGDVLLHELRVPASLLKAYAVSTMVGAKDAVVITNEAEAAYTLRRVQFAEQAFKEGKKKERYGTLEELLAEQLLEKDFIEHLGYKIELNAVGDKYEATATPKTYGKTGRRSFFVNEAGEVRGADHSGKPATADDPTVD